MIAVLFTVVKPPRPPPRKTAISSSDQNGNVPPASPSVVRPPAIEASVPQASSGVRKRSYR